MTQVHALEALACILLLAILAYQLIILKLLDERKRLRTRVSKFESAMACAAELDECCDCEVME